MNSIWSTNSRGIRPLIRSLRKTHAAQSGRGHHPPLCIHKYIEVSRQIDKNGVEIITKKCTKCGIKKEKRVYHYQHVM